ncbi:hypothetical protein BGX29_002027 [Mortierella sp. GBA35]|nr:hypothetical protein BGX29_002027 [Mortierella sp. GBA35]
MDDLPPFVRKYVSKPYYDQLDWNAKTAYLKGIQDVMAVFSKELEDRAMQVLITKAHWLEPRNGRSSAPIEFSSSSAAAIPKAGTAAATTAKAGTATATATKTATPAASQASQAKKGWQPTQPSQSSQSFSQTLKGSQASQPSSQSTTSQPHLKRKATEASTLDTEITFVGMRYRSGHVFSPSDKVRLERDHKNPVDKNAIKVMVLKNGTWFHAAYVGRDDASALKDQLGIEHMKLTYLRAYLASVKYRLQA